MGNLTLGVQAEMKAQEKNASEMQFFFAKDTVLSSSAPCPATLSSSSGHLFLLVRPSLPPGPAISSSGSGQLFFNNLSCLVDLAKSRKDRLPLQTHPTFFSATGVHPALPVCDQAASPGHIHIHLLCPILLSGPIHSKAQQTRARCPRLLTNKQ